MDIEAVMTMAPHLAGIYVYLIGSVDGGFYQMALDNIITSASTSFVEEGEGSEHDSVYATFQLMAAQGQTVFAGSGDWGAAGIDGNTVETIDPASHPFVTGVGGTMPQSGWQANTNFYPGEGAWNQSGGGISSWPIPSWQVAAANSYNNTNRASTTYRNVPDVAAYAGSHYTPWFYILLTEVGLAGLWDESRHAPMGRLNGSHKSEQCRPWSWTCRISKSNSLCDWW